jgi:hypothetical protein
MKAANPETLKSKPGNAPVSVVDGDKLIDGGVAHGHAIQRAS